MMPAPVLRSVISAGLESENMDLPIENSVDFMEEKLSTIDMVTTCIEIIDT